MQRYHPSVGGRDRLGHHPVELLDTLFDIKAFGEVVLQDGALPLDVLEEQLDAYIARMKAG